ncbi:MAG: KilA-N domain-containing protein [Phormidesmis sp. RL_2_1]|nr:KilA-N domain-containing protein [Phormidesmis sp. RL_2_1]
MTENSIVRQFNQAKIEQRVTDGYINLNQMAKATEKRIDNWLQNRSTQELLTEFKNQQNKLPGIPGSLSEPLITIEGRSGGTWAHPDIAIQFAQWCSPAFALQVSRWVREWLTTGHSPLANTDRVGLRSTLKDDSRLRMTDQVKVYLEQIQRYDDRKYRGQFFARVHDAINQAVTGETAKEMRERLSQVLARKVAQKELIRDYFPALVLQRYISMCEASANFMIREELHPLTAVERAAEIVLYAGYQPKAIDFVEHIKFVRQRLTTGQGGFELPEA